MYQYGNGANKLMSRIKSQEYIYFDRIITKLDSKKLEKNYWNIKIESSFFLKVLNCL